MNVEKYHLKRACVFWRQSPNDAGEKKEKPVIGVAPRLQVCVRVCVYVHLCVCQFLAFAEPTLPPSEAL